MTRGELVFETSRMFGLDDTVGGDELKLMQSWYNRAVRDVLLKTHCYVDLGSLTLQAGVTDYRLDTTVIAVLEITAPDNSGIPYELRHVSQGEIVPYLSSSIAASATPTRIAIEGNFARVAPIPSSAVVLTYVYVPDAPDVAADGTIANDNTDPSLAAAGGIPIGMHECLLAFMAWKAADYDDKTTAMNAKDYRTAYEGLCKDARKHHRRKAGRALSGARVGYPGTRGISTRNDVYPNFTR